MLETDCRELTADERLALASSISEELAGAALALIKGDSIVFDRVEQHEVDPKVIEGAVRRFVSRRRDAEHYSVEREGERVIVHSPNPIAALHSRRQNELPPNLKKCPFCPFVTPYEELYTAHVRAHLFGV